MTNTKFNPENITVGDYVFFRTSNEAFKCEHLKGFVNDIYEKDGQKTLLIWTCGNPNELESRRFDIATNQALAIADLGNENLPSDIRANCNRR